MRKSLILIAIFFILAMFSSSAAAMVGGFGESTKANNEIAQILNSAKPNILSAGSLPKNAKLTPISFRTQVVAGLNYLVKVQIDDGTSVKYADVKIYRPLPPNHENLEILSFQPSTLEGSL